MPQRGADAGSSLINVWSYRSLDSAWWKPADGLSLPLARLYCKYFGGSLAMVPMEGKSSSFQPPSPRLLTRRHPCPLC